MAAVLSLVFAQGQRPEAAHIAALQQSKGEGIGISISHRPHPDEGWVELLGNGLTFDCRGLAPASPAALPPEGVLLGLDLMPRGEALELLPAPHLAAGRGMPVVVRTLAALGLRLAELPGLAAVCWQPAQSWMAPDYFRKIAADWLAGGAFPALGLTTLRREEGGVMVSRGLALLTGQELRFEAAGDLAPARIARIMVRLINEFAEHGPLREATAFTGPEGERLRVVPVDAGHWLSVSVE